MAARELTVELVSRPGGTAWTGAATAISVPLVDGELGILPGRAPILALLGRGTVRISCADGSREEIRVAGGFASVDQDMVTIAADRAGDEIHGDDSDFDPLITSEGQFHPAEAGLAG